MCVYSFSTRHKNVTQTHPGLSVMRSYRFEFLSVQLASIEKQSRDGVSCSGRLQGGWCHVQEILFKNKNKTK